MNIKDFLLDNYIYILIVIGLIIITVIGFLADKKGKGKSKEVLPNNNSNLGNVNYANQQMPPQGQPMNYQPVNTNENNSQLPNNMPINNNMQINSNIFGQPSNGIVNSVNNGFNDLNNNQMNQGIINQQPVDTLNNNLNAMPGMLQGTIVSPNLNNAFEQSSQQFTPVQPIIPQVAEPVQNVIPQTVEPVQNAIPQMVEPVAQNVIPQVIEPINNNASINPEPMYQSLTEQRPFVIPNDSINDIQSIGQVTPNNSGFNNNQNFVNGFSNGVDQVAPINNVLPDMGQNVNPVPIPTPTTAVPTQPMPIPNPTNIPVTPVPVDNQMFNNQNMVQQPVNNSQLNFVYGNQQSGQGNNNGYMQ